VAVKLDGAPDVVNCGPGHDSVRVNRRDAADRYVDCESINVS
jgi:hypothetical protein